MTTVMKTKGIALDTMVLASSQQVCCDVADEAVLLSLSDGEYYGLNEVAASIWRLVQQPRTVLEVRNLLLAEYGDIDADECERGVMGFLSEMHALDLVKLA